MDHHATAPSERVIQSSNDIFRKIAKRLLPVLFLAYCIAFLDRVNVGFTQLQMGEALGISPSQYGFAAGIFFVSYAIFEVPSNALFARMGARRSFLRIMLLWGLVVIATAFVKNATQFYALRLLLGIFEAGFFPGMILYLSYWFPSSHRARVTSAVALANAVAATISGPLTATLMSSLDGTLGLQGWQWVFLAQGVPACVLGVVCYFSLTDRPENAAWLTQKEKGQLAAALKSSEVVTQQTGTRGVTTVLRDPVIYLLALLYFCSSAANYLFNFWLPTIIRDSGINKLTHIGILAMLPMLAGCVGMIALNFSSDFFRERRWHLALGYALAAVGLFVATLYRESLVLTLVAFSVANVGIMAVFPLLWTLPTAYLPSAIAPFGVAFISTLGITAGFASPYFFGLVRTYTGSFAIGIYVLSALLILCVALICMVLPRSATEVRGASWNQ